MNIFFSILSLVAFFGSAHAHDLTPEESCMEDALDQPHLYVPWRGTYVHNSFKSDAKVSSEIQVQKPCPFCLQRDAHTDERYLILRRFKHHMVMLNLYPYSKGHLLIVPLEHKANLHDFSVEARTELIELATACTAIIQKLFECPGFNIGFNIGRIAGATIPDHMHMQVVPRRNVDFSFMQVLGNTRVTSWDMHELYQQLKPHVDAIVL